MKVEERLRRLEEGSTAASREPLRVLIQFVDPGPAIGVVSVLAMAEGSPDRQWFEREESETGEELCERARAGWN